MCFAYDDLWKNKIYQFCSFLLKRWKGIYKAKTYKENTQPITQDANLLHMYCQYNIVKLASPWREDLQYNGTLQTKAKNRSMYVMYTQSHVVNMPGIDLTEFGQRSVVARDGREAQSISKDCALIDVGSSIITSIHLRSPAGLASAGGFSGGPVRLSLHSPRCFISHRRSELRPSSESRIYLPFGRAYVIISLFVFVSVFVFVFVLDSIPAQ